MAFLVVVLAGVAMGQSFPIEIYGEPLNGKIISFNVDSTGTADITFPVFIAPCLGYIPAPPRFVCRSGSAVADTTAAKHWELYFWSTDSIATAAKDTIARYRTDSSAVTLTTINNRGRIGVGVNHRMNWLSAATSRVIHRGDVISLRMESVGSTPVTLDDFTLQFWFIPYTTKAAVPD